eukprot:2500074-Rhodomonas_salina.3
MLLLRGAAEEIRSDCLLSLSLSLSVCHVSIALLRTGVRHASTRSTPHRTLRYYRTPRSTRVGQKGQPTPKRGSRHSWQRGSSSSPSTAVHRVSTRLYCTSTVQYSRYALPVPGIAYGSLRR